MPRLCTPIRAFIPFVCSLYKRNKKTKLGLEIPDQNVLWRCSYSPASFFSFSLVYLRNRTPWVICAPVFVKWQAKRSKFLGCTCNNWNHIMKTVHYLTKKNYKSMLPSRQMIITSTTFISYDVIKLLPKVIFPLIIAGSFCVSARAASGIPQLATGPQKWVLIKSERNVMD